MQVKYNKKAVDHINAVIATESAMAFVLFLNLSIFSSFSVYKRLITDFQSI